MLYRFIDHLLQPYTFFLLLALAALLYLGWKCRERRRAVFLALLPVAGLCIFSLPLTSYLALASLEWQIPLVEVREPDIQAIVVLSGGAKFPDAYRKTFEPDTDTMVRCIHAAKLYHQGKPCPILVTGGTEYPGSGGPSLAEAMFDFLQRLGVKAGDIWMEPTAQTTYENARNCAKILERKGISKVLLVTEALHMPRSVRVFRKAGMDVIASPCPYEASQFRPRPDSILPSAHAARNTQRACHEWMGLAWYWLRGRI